MTDEPTNEWAEELNERYKAQLAEINMTDKPTNKWEEEFDKKFPQVAYVREGMNESDFHTGKAQVKNFIRSLIAKERQEERERIFEEIDKIIGRATKFDGGEITGVDHELVDTCELYIPLQKLKKTYER